MELTSNQKEQLNNAIVILNSVFDENLTSQSFGSKVFEGPFNLTEPFSFAYEDNKAIGVAAFMGAKLMVKRKELTVSQAMECAVLKEYQGKGYFYKIIHSFETDNKESEFIFGFPNKISHPRFMKFGYSMPLWLNHFIYPTSPFSFVFGKNKVSTTLDNIYQKFLWIKKDSANPNVTLSIFDGMEKYPVSNDEIAALSSGRECYFIHSKEFFAWKQEYNPDTNFFWSVLRKKDGTLLGYALCHLRPRLKGNFVIIDDYAVKEDSPKKNLILKKLFAALMNLGDILEVPFTNVELEGKTLKSLHFINACKFPFPLRGAPVILSPNCKYVQEMKNCAFRNIDSDIL